MIDLVGREILVVAAKATFELEAEGEAVAADEPSPLRVNDDP
jgi:hypothetical protein